MFNFNDFIDVADNTRIKFWLKNSTYTVYQLLNRVEGESNYVITREMNYLLPDRKVWLILLSQGGSLTVNQFYVCEKSLQVLQLSLTCKYFMLCNIDLCVYGNCSQVVKISKLLTSDSQIKIDTCLQ